jgi:hypothetical protein
MKSATLCLFLLAGCGARPAGEPRQSFQGLALIGVRVNEVESNGGVPGDWVELVNTNAEAVDISGWRFRDNDNTHTYVVPAGTSIESGGYLVLDEAVFNFGLGAGDSARLFDASETLVDSFAWTSHAVSTYGRCPDGSGAFRQTNSTKGADNDCSSIRINEIESSGGVPGDWVELINTSPTAVDLSGWVLKDNDDTHSYVLPAATTLAPGGLLVLNEVVSGAGEFNFGLGSADSVRLYDGLANLVDAHTWTAHAATTYGRCPNGSGAFTTSTASTKGALNDCGQGPVAAAWPGSNMVVTADATNALGNNVSDLFYEPGDVLWAVRNNPSILYRLVRSGAIWSPEAANGWDAGKTMRYPDGTGVPDAEGVTRAELTSPAIYVATERDNNAGNVSRLSILRFDTAQAGSDLNATHEWNLTADLPVAGSNLGLEALTWVPDTFLVANGFFDDSAGHTYAPSDHPNHGSGLFFAQLETSGLVYVYALDHAGGGFVRVATFASGNSVGKALTFDRDTGYLWAACGSSCGNQVQVLAIDGSPTSATYGKFRPLRRFAAPSTMPNLANEGIGIAPESTCAGGFKAFVWADDGNTLGHALRSDTVRCGRFIDDPDGDGVLDPGDNCPSVANASQVDTDGDAQGDACDADDDNDGIADSGDNCPLTANVDQTDSDADGSGDACDADDDNDGVADAGDNCPFTANADQTDSDGDGSGNACDADDDNDGIADAGDNCPLTANADQIDSDGDGSGDACDADDDSDGVADAADACPGTAPGAVVNGRGCSIAQLAPCNANWRNHGAYVLAVTRAVALFVAARLITLHEGLRIIQAAATSSCGR